LDAFRAIPSGRKKVGHYTRMMASSLSGSEKENSLSPENRNYV